MSGDASPDTHKPFIFKKFLMVITIVLVSVLSFLLGFYVGRNQEEFASPRLFAVSGEPDGSPVAKLRDDVESPLSASPEERVAAQSPESVRTASGVPPASSGQSGIGTSGRTSRYYVQIGAFSSFSDADRLKSNLAQKGYNIHIETDASGRRELYKVRLGPYAVKEQAERALSDMKRAGKEKPFLIVID